MRDGRANAGERSSRIAAALPPEGRAALILAAGESRRMGTAKLTLRIAGETLLSRCVRHAREAGLDPIVVVVAEDADAASELVAEDLDLVHASPRPSHAHTLSESLAAGAAAIPKSSATVTILLADMPFVSSAVLQRLARHRSHGAKAVATDRGGFPSPPMIVDRTVLDTMSAVPDRRRFLRSLGPALRLVRLPEGALDDVDTPVDYARALRRGGERAR